MSDLRQDITAWQRVAFPDSTVSGIAAHLHEEARELLADARQVEMGEVLCPGSRDRASVEAADVYLLLIAFCDHAGIDLDTAARKKLEENKRRTWGPQNKDGYSKHVE